jgi:uncharacterized protein
MTVLATTRPAWSRVARRWGFRVLRVAALVYLGLMGILSSMQAWLIFPGASTQGQAHAVVTPPMGAELVTLNTAEGEQVAALFGPALKEDGLPHPDAAHRPSLIFFYGNGMCLSYSVPEFEQLRRLGLNVIVPEYLGYGMSSGSPSEAGCYAAADAAYGYLLKRSDIDSAKIVAAGWSLGGAVAVDLAARRPIARLILFSSFTSMGDMARRVLPFLPVSLLLRHRFDSAQKLPRVTCPILIGHGLSDEIVPTSMADQLASLARVEVSRLDIEGADHNYFFAVGGRKIFKAIEHFLEPLSRAAG